MPITSHDRRDGPWTGAFVGLAIAGLGIILLLDQTGLFGWQTSWSVWPFLVIGFGLARFASPRPDGSRDGVGLIFIGVWLLLNEMRVLRFRDSWPLILVAIGVHTMWKAISADLKVRYAADLKVRTTPGPDSSADGQAS